MMTTTSAGATSSASPLPAQQVFGLALVPGSEVALRQQVEVSLQLYLAAMVGCVGATQQMLIQRDASRLASFFQGVKLICALPASHAAKLAFTRELINMFGSCTLGPEVNQDVLGHPRSAFWEDVVAQQPENRLAMLMRAPMAGPGYEAQPWILSVSAPALDDVIQPEYAVFTVSGRLDIDAYSRAHAVLASQVETAASQAPGIGKVVLSAYGMNAFLSGLHGQDQLAAKQCGARHMAALAGRLEQKGLAVAYADGQEEGTNWKMVHDILGRQLEYVGRVPGPWVADDVLLVNAWDPHSLVGNGCAIDGSIDGYVGRSSLVHPVHAMLSIAWQKQLVRLAGA